MYVEPPLRVMKGFEEEASNPGSSKLGLTMIGVAPAGSSSIAAPTTRREADLMVAAIVHPNRGSV
jgi:hypothetical protein